jgi:hypothetical protein
MPVSLFASQWLTLFVTPKTEPATLALAVRILTHVLIHVRGIFGQPILYNFRYGYFVCRMSGWDQILVQRRRACVLCFFCFRAVAGLWLFCSGWTWT